MTTETAVTHHSGAQSRSQWLDVQLAALADRQHRVVSTHQLLGLGFGRGAIALRVRGGRLHPVHRGVYAVGTRKLSREGVWMAAVLAGGEGGVLSDRTAAAAGGLLRADHGQVHVTVPRKMRSRSGLRFHHRLLSAAETTTIDGIPTTTVARTIFDLSATQPRRVVERAVHEAEVLRTIDVRDLDAILDRSPHARGVRQLRSILADRSFGTAATKEELEAALMAFVVEERLPLPETNIWLRIGDTWIEADCVWREQKLIAELDGWGVHGTRRNFESDRERDRALQVEGWRPIRVTWRHLHRGRAKLAADLRALLGVNSPAARPA
jgi:very-short-patch-repair endonuclease